MRVRVFYHDKCFDGASSAALFSRFYRERISSDATFEFTGLVHRAGALFKLSVPLGIASGVIAGALYNRFGTIKLPPYLAFFGGRRFVPIVSGVAGLALAIVAGLGWTSLDRGIDALSHAIVRAGPARSISSSMRWRWSS